MWSCLIQEIKDPKIDKIGLCFVIDYHGYAFIARRPPLDSLPGLYELPQGILYPGEDLFEGAKRILWQHYHVELESLSRYLGSFSYLSGALQKTEMFCFLVKVVDIFSLKIQRHDHGVWMQPSEIRSWPIIQEFCAFLLGFWFGEGFDPVMTKARLVLGRREEAVARFKVRVVLFKSGKVLALKRARRQRSLPLYYEFPGKEVSAGGNIEEAIVSTVFEQTGSAPRHITGFLDFFDYETEFGAEKKEKVRELIYTATAQTYSVKLAEHSYFSWVADHKKEQQLSLTPSALVGFEAFLERTFANLPRKVARPPTLHHNPSLASWTPEKERYLDAMYALESRGSVDLEALKGKELIKNAFSSEMQKRLQL